MNASSGLPSRSKNSAARPCIAAAASWTAAARRSAASTRGMNGGYACHGLPSRAHQDSCRTALRHPGLPARPAHIQPPGLAARYTPRFGIWTRRAGPRQACSAGALQEFWLSSVSPNENRGRDTRRYSGSPRCVAPALWGAGGAGGSRPAPPGLLANRRSRVGATCRGHLALPNAQQCGRLRGGTCGCGRRGTTCRWADGPSIRACWCHVRCSE